MEEFAATRRRFIGVCTTLGIGSGIFIGALQALAQENPKMDVTTEMINRAAALAGIEITADNVQAMKALLNTQMAAFDSIRQLHLPNSIQPAYHFDPILPGSPKPVDESRPQRKTGSLSDLPDTALRERPKVLEELAFASVRELGALLQSRKISAVELTRMSLDRLKRYDSKLHCVVHLTEERALAQAAVADAEIAKGIYRGPLHGIPYGAKDLLAVKGYPTTWGAAGFEDQTFPTDATIVQRLDEAGAVLVAKLSLGALAMNDIWFGGRTRNPWNLNQGSSGSSAGSAAAVAAGCVPFAIGSETLGSISSPSTRCGVTGYRPTFGFVPRTGAMALAWTMDKLGPIARTSEDCALVMQSIYGPDGHDAAARSAPFSWDGQFEWKTLKIGFIASDFEPKQQPDDQPPPWLTESELKDWKDKQPDRDASRARQNYDLKFHNAALDHLRSMGLNLKPIELPKLPFDSIALLLNAEAASAFDDLTRSGRDHLLTGQTPDDWPNIFRVARLYPAVEYIQANRARTLAMKKMAEIFENFDVILTLNSSQQLIATNLTGHPAVIVPDGFRALDAPQPAAVDDSTDDNIGGPGTPTSLTFVGTLYHDSSLLALAHAFQQTTRFHLNHPPGFGQNA
jgi:Asp-tRNA(Asn)/Glu-tRNA(Gln) amidotransferase A subunit family amidase